ncbi:hypothetical protein CANCADRAFT_89122 [Tortispora caseinolytica NRRL Y-17796]|uniref:GPN-loop GTPase 2 n=1 Tax=Tortispora caseinolytica NRRL Y-17796 TaxID=767744 RepID=A0A1E4TLQ8_9ASCO|nr:hypothetical protein CANCADRAFT_89122 [Tortispora caseinolytica NRRL Y-17796]
MPQFGQLVIGPPGAGKSTYCYGMFQFLSAIGRKASVVNLDPANDHVQYPCALDVRTYLKIEDVMETENLGPNGGIMRSMDILNEHWDEFYGEIKKLKGEYLLFDCPGQVEIFTHNNSLKTIFEKLQKDDYRLVVVNLIDSIHIISPSQYVSVLTLALRSMLQFTMPVVNVLTKIDLLHGYGKLDFNLDFYTEVQDIERLYPLVDQESSRMGHRLQGLTRALGELVTEFGLVAFEVLAVEDKRSMISLLLTIDKANGYAFGSTEIGGDSVWIDSVRQGGLDGADGPSLQERWIDYKDHYDRIQQEEFDKFQQAMEQQPAEPLSEEDQWLAEVKKFEQEFNMSAHK